MILSKRGRVIVRNREKLEELAGDSYGIPEAEYQNLIGPPRTDCRSTLPRQGVAR